MTDGTTNEIMEATYRALCEHGYASLRMQDIADETTKSKAALHYHYDTKHDLLVGFLDHLYDEFESYLADIEGADPTARLEAYVRERLTPQNEREHHQFQTAMLAIKSQAPYDAAFREHLREFDRRAHEFVQTLLVAGIEERTLRASMDPERVANVFVTTISGAETRHVAIGYSITEAREFLLEYIDTTLRRRPEVAAE